MPVLNSNKTDNRQRNSEQTEEETNPGRRQNHRRHRGFGGPDSISPPGYVQALY